MLGVVAGENHTVHIPPFNNFQSRINSSNTNYTGVELVRCIPSHHWQACYLRAGSEWFLADLYITYNDQWSLTFMSERSPVSIEVFHQRMDNLVLYSLIFVTQSTMYCFKMDRMLSQTKCYKFPLACLAEDAKQENHSLLFHDSSRLDLSSQLEILLLQPRCVNRPFCVTYRLAL